MTRIENDQPAPAADKAIRGVDRLIAHVRTMEPVPAAVIHPCDALSLGGAIDAFRGGIILPILIAPEIKLRAVAEQAGIDISDCRIIDVPHSHAAAAKGAELAAKGEVEILVKGSLHSDELMGAIIPASASLRTGRRITHCFVMETAAYPRPFIITDAAINIAPTLDVKADIVRNAIDLAHAIGVDEPKVAILAAVETINPRMQSTLDAAALCKMADRGQICGGILDGPLAFDNAVSPDAVRVKGIRSAVAGHADILVVPDLESGNMLAKQLEYMGHADSAGVVMGARVPIVLTSRSDSRQSRLASCAIALVLAHRRRAALAETKAAAPA